MDRPNQNVFQTPQPPGTLPGSVEPSPDTDPEAGPPAMAGDPADWSTAPMGGDIPPTNPPQGVRTFDAWRYRDDTGIGDGADLVGYTIIALDSAKKYACLASWR